MAKTATKEKAEKKAAPEEFKYGVDDVADALGIKPASARVQLRNNNIEKAGKSYGWNSKSEVEEVVKKLKGDAPKKAEKKTEKAEKKPAATVKKVKKEAA